MKTIKASLFLLLALSSPGFAADPRGIEFNGIDDTGSAGDGMTSTFADDYSIAGTVTILDDTLSVSGQTIFSQPHATTSEVGIKGIYRNSAAQPELFEVELTLYSGTSYFTSVFSASAPVLSSFDFAVTVEHQTGPTKIVAKIYIDTFLEHTQTISGGQAGTAPTEEFWVGTDEGIDKYANMLLCRLSVWSRVLDQNAVAYYASHEVADTASGLVSAWEQQSGAVPRRHWPDVANENDINLNHNGMWSPACDAL